MIKFILLGLSLATFIFVFYLSQHIKVRQKRLIKKLGLSKENPIATIYTTDKYRNILGDNVYCKHNRDFSIFSKSNRFYLVKHPHRKYKLCLYCEYNNLPKELSYKSIFDTKNFFWVPLEDKYLLNFLENGKYIIDNGHITRMIA